MTTSYPEKKKSPCALAEKGLCLHSMVENLPGFAYSYQLTSDGKQKFLYASDNVLDIYGLDAQTIQEDLQKLRLSFNKQDLEAFEKNIIISAQTLQPFHAEFRYLHPVKGLIWLETRSQPARQKDGGIIWHGITLDISHRKQAQERLVQTAGKLSALLNTIPDLIWMKDLEGKFLICNDAFEKFFRTSEEEICGKIDYEFIEKELADFYRKKDLETIQKGNIISSEEQIVNSATGEMMIADTRKAPVYDEEGNILGVLGIAKNITHKKELQLQLHEKEIRLKEAQRIAKICSWHITFPECSLYFDEEVYKILDISITTQAPTYEHFLALVYPDDKNYVDALFKKSIQEKTPFDVIHRLKDKNGTIRYIHLHAEIIYDSYEMPEQAIGILQDITEQKLTEEKMVFFTHHDVLTGLPNRALAIDRLEQALIYAKRNKTKIALLHIDIDGFKTINDSLGYHMGDAIIKAVAKRLQENLKETDTISRQGGDEFLVILPDINDADSISAIATRLIKKLNEAIIVDSYSLSSTVSMGIALSPDDGENFEILLQKADTAMHKAKESGGNAYCFFAEHMNKEITEHLSFIQDMKQALFKNEFELYFQPQIDLQTNQLCGAEALLRWNHSTKGLIPPMSFIPIAESSGLIIQIGEKVIHDACHQAALWHKEGIKCNIAVNISAIQLQRGNLEEIIKEALSLSGLDPFCLELELTESVLIKDTEQTLQSIKRLKNLGIKLSIDDFGTGYSSLAYLKRFAVDKLKIDKSFIQDIAKDQENIVIVQAIIQIAKSLGLKTIAEGVETQEIVELVKRYECDEVQGYFYAKPMPYGDFIEFCNNSGFRN